MESELRQLFLDCLKKKGPGIETARLSGLSPEDWQAFLSLATTQKVIALLWHRLREKGLDQAVPFKVAEVLQGGFRRNILRNLCLYRDLHSLLSVLNPEGTPLIVLKGIYLADVVYGNIGLRQMNDIDVLSRPADL